MRDSSDAVKEYFFDPKDAEVVERTDAAGEVGAIASKDALKLMPKMDVHPRIVADARRIVGRSSFAPRPTPARATAPKAIVPSPSAYTPAALPTTTAARRIELIERTIDMLRPRFQRDGGDCELVDVDGNTVFVKFTGACVGCQLASMTVAGVQMRLIEALNAPIRVVPVQASH